MRFISKTQKKTANSTQLKAAYGWAALPFADPLLDLPRANDDVRNLRKEQQPCHDLRYRRRVTDQPVRTRRLNANARPRAFTDQNRALAASLRTVLVRPT